MHNVTQKKTKEVLSLFMLFMSLAASVRYKRELLLTYAFLFYFYLLFICVVIESFIYYLFVCLFIYFKLKLSEG